LGYNTWDVGNPVTKIHTSFGRSCTVLEHRYKDNILYSGLGNVSRAALCYISEEAKRFKEIDTDKKNCGCVIRTSYELPWVVVHVSLLWKFITTSPFDCMWYTVIDKCYVWVKKVMKNFFCHRGVEWYSGTSQKSSLPNETTNQRGFVLVNISWSQNVVSASKKGANERSQEKCEI